MSNTGGKSKGKPGSGATGGVNSGASDLDKDADMDVAADRSRSDAAPGPVIGEDIQNHLGQRLRATYDELVNQPVPDKFLQLLEELERREKSQ
jgi:Anti-sigma factor NepR